MIGLFAMAAQAVTAVPALTAAATQGPDASEVVPYFTSAATIIYLQKYLKQREFYRQFVAAFPGADKYAHWFIAGVLSLFAATGIHLVWTCALCQHYDPNSGGAALIKIPSVIDMLHGLGDFWKVFILQHFGHDVTSQRALPPAGLP